MRTHPNFAFTCVQSTFGWYQLEGYSTLRTLLECARIVVKHMYIMIMMTSVLHRVVYVDCAIKCHVPSLLKALNENVHIRS